MSIALASKPGITGANVLSIPKDWDPVWFRRFIDNSLKGADVRNAIGANGITISGNISSPYATIGFTGGVAQIVAGTNITISPPGGTGVVTINASSGGIATPSCIFTVNNLTVLTTTNLTTEGTLDWFAASTAMVIGAQLNPSGGRKRAGGLIDAYGLFGVVAITFTGTFNTVANNWQGTSAAGDNGNDALGTGTFTTGAFFSATPGQGIYLRVPADTHTKVLRLYMSNATPYTVIVSMSDGNSFSTTVTTPVNAQIVISYNASRDGCTAIVYVTKTVSNGNLGYMGATLGIV